MNHRSPIAAMLALLLSMLCAPAVRAQEESATSPWSIAVAPYIWLSEVQGTIGVRDKTAHLDVGFADLFDLMGNGELFAGGGHAEVRYDRFSFFLDAFGGTARPTSDVTVGRVVQRSGTADVTVNWSFFEFGPTYRLLKLPTSGPGRPITIDALAGGRLMYFYQSLTLRGDLGRFDRYSNASSTWVDPFVGGRFAVPVWDELDVVFRADIGGFGAGSELAWSLVAGFQYILPWQPAAGRRRSSRSTRRSTSTTSPTTATCGRRPTSAGRGSACCSASDPPKRRSGTPVWRTRHDARFAIWRVRARLRAAPALVNVFATIGGGEGAVAAIGGGEEEP
ncbi:MAG: hypothetical protein FJ148_05930 [Deltaproteobacteria bacterium]|nr:hypothetical protein [Deltaproteobacteria bacterium]